MKLNPKKILFAFSLLAGLLFSSSIYAQTACCSTAKHDKESCTTKEGKSNCATTAATTSGCSPSSCRGAKTKFGEAKVITDLRLNLIALKANMEKSQRTTFDARSYDIHGIVGETDDESLQIITDEVKVIESAFVEKLEYKPAVFNLPENKAKQVQYLSARIEQLKKQLL